MDIKNNAVTGFEEKYKREPEHTAFTPYRICPLGAHSDHQLGKITGFAINKGIHIAYAAKHNGVIEITSLQFLKRAQWHIASTPPERQGDWADHLRGATIALGKRYALRTRLCAVIDGELPIGGLSYSAAVIITLQDARLIPEAIASGCSTDAPGSFIDWLCKKSAVYAMEMPGKRYDIGNLESYETVKKEYGGITVC